MLFCTDPSPPPKKKNNQKKINLMWVLTPMVIAPHFGTHLIKGQQKSQDSIRWNVKRKNKEYSPFVYGFATFLLVITLAVALLTCQQTDRD